MDALVVLICGKDLCTSDAFLGMPHVARPMGSHNVWLGMEIGIGGVDLRDTGAETLQMA